MSIARRDFRLRSGAALSFSTLGFGAAPIGNMHRRLEEEEAAATVESAWAAGMRYFDTAPLYGHGLSERRVGAALREKPRDEFVVSTKVGRLLEPCAPGEEEAGIYKETPQVRVRFAYSYDAVMRSFEESLSRLGLGRIDILYVHDVDALTHGNDEAADARIGELLDTGGWRALDELRSTGAVAAIGAGVNTVRACERLLELADPDIFLLAGRYTLLDQSAAVRLLPACVERGVAVVLGGPYNSGILATGPVPGAWYDYEAAPEPILARARRLQEVCERHDVPLARAALHFPLSHPAIVSVIPGSQTRAEVERNVATFTDPPPAALWRELAGEGLITSEAAAALGA
ncbi:MAG TPA: aldo/keto reductase [Allosphingosinicella sp.]|jgi:D-threo-aldose 1-dehydrogenase